MDGREHFRKPRVPHRRVLVLGQFLDGILATIIDSSAGFDFIGSKT